MGVACGFGELLDMSKFVVWPAWTDDGLVLSESFFLVANFGSSSLSGRRVFGAV